MIFSHTKKKRGGHQKKGGVKSRLGNGAVFLPAPAPPPLKRNKFHLKKFRFWSGKNGAGAVKISFFLPAPAPAVPFFEKKNQIFFFKINQLFAE